MYISGYNKTKISVLKLRDLFKFSAAPDKMGCLRTKNSVYANQSAHACSLVSAGSLGQYPDYLMFLNTLTEVSDLTMPG